MKTYKGKYRPKNPNKYIGDSTNIIYRSSWERRVMKWLDLNDNVLFWSSEEIIIPYISPLDNKKHRYFPDFLIKAKTKDGEIKTILIEVKPKAQTIEPTKKEKITKQYINEVVTWGVNKAKWTAAEKFCLEKGWLFKILTEDELGLNK